MTAINPHGGQLINRLVEGEAKAFLLKQLSDAPVIPISRWTISDLDLIGVGAFSPLSGFMNQEDYKSVVASMRLADGTVWSIPITLAVQPELAAACGCKDTKFF